MKSALISTFILLGASLSGLCDNIKIIANPDPEKLDVLTDSLVIIFPDEVPVRNGQTTIDYEIVNRTSDDIFVVINSENVDGWVSLKKSEGLSGMVGGGQSTGSFTTHASLRLLYAPLMENGSVSTGESDMASRTYATVNVGTGSPDMDLSHWVGYSGKLNLRLKYWVSKSSGFRITNVEVPVKLIQSEQAGADQPTTAPDSEPENEVKPQSESEDRPR